MYLLDTDTCIFLLNRKNLLVEYKLKSLKRDEVALSSITAAELYYGARHSGRHETNENKVKILCSSITLVAFEEDAARLFGKQKEYLMSRGEMIGIFDLLIASVALAKKATLVTHNTKEFGRLPDLKVEDWFVES